MEKSAQYAVGATIGRPAILKQNYIVKKNPSIENLIAYEKYVFIDCEKYYKRYGRRGVKK